MTIEDPIAAMDMSFSGSSPKRKAVNPRVLAPGTLTATGDEDPPGLDEDQDVGVVIQESEPELKRPPMFKVMLLNDDYTPMEFVVHILEIFFGMNREKATQIMLVVHTEGAAVVGIFPRDIAETKSEQVNQYAQENNHPLMSTVELAD